MVKKDEKELVSVTNSDGLLFSGDFDKVLKDISTTVDRTSKLITTQDLDTAAEKLDVNELDKVISDLAQAQKMARTIERGRRQVAKAFNVRRDLVLKQFDEKVNAAGYDKLATYHEDAKALKRTVRERRKNQRLEEIVKPTFDSLIKSYPLINTLAPQLATSESFILRNPSIVGGGKKDPEESEIRNTIITYLNGLETNLKTLQDNPYNLTSNEQNTVLTAYLANPTDENFQNSIAQVLTYRQQAQQQQNQQFSNTELQQGYQWLIGYVAGHVRKYGNIQSDYTQVLNLVDDLMTQYHDRKSSLWRDLLSHSQNVEYLMYRLLWQAFNLR